MMDPEMERALQASYDADFLTIPRPLAIALVEAAETGRDELIGAVPIPLGWFIAPAFVRICRPEWFTEEGCWTEEENAQEDPKCHSASPQL